MALPQRSVRRSRNLFLYVVRPNSKAGKTGRFAIKVTSEVNFILQPRQRLLSRKPPKTLCGLQRCYGVPEVSEFERRPLRTSAWLRISTLAIVQRGGPIAPQKA